MTFRVKQIRFTGISNINPKHHISGNKLYTWTPLGNNSSTDKRYTWFLSWAPMKCTLRAGIILSDSEMKEWMKRMMLNQN